MTELFISTILPWIVSAALLGLIVQLLMLGPRLIQSFWAMPWIIKISLLLIFCLGSYVRFQFVPNTHRIYYDEDRYLSYSLTFAKFGQAKSIILATENAILRGDPDKVIRHTIPIFHAWLFRFFGYSEHPLFIAAKIASSFQILLIAILAYILFRNHSTALTGALGMALLPPVVFWSVSLALDSYFVTFTLLSLVAAGLYGQKRSPMNGLFLITATFLLLCVRFESFAVLPLLIGIVYIVRNRNTIRLYTLADIPYTALLLGVIAIRAIASISTLTQKWCCAEALPLEAFYPSYFIRNLLPNIFDLFVRPEFPFVITVLAIVALIHMKSASIALLGVWFSIFFLLYSTYYAGMFYTGEFSGSYGRYFLIFIPPLLLLAGWSVSQLHGFLMHQNILKRIAIYIIFVVFVLVSCIPTIRNYRTLITVSPYFRLVDQGPQELHQYMERYFIPSTPKDSLILTNLAGVVLTSGRASGLLGVFLDNEAMQQQVVNEMRNGRRVFSNLPYQCVQYSTECDKIYDLVYFIPMDSTPPHPEGVQIAEIKLLEDATPSAEQLPANE